MIQPLSFWWAMFKEQDLEFRGSRDKMKEWVEGSKGRILELEIMQDRRAGSDEALTTLWSPLFVVQALSSCKTDCFVNSSFLGAPCVASVPAQIAPSTRCPSLLGGKAVPVSLLWQVLTRLSCTKGQQPAKETSVGAEHVKTEDLRRFNFSFSNLSIFRGLAPLINV